MIESATHKGRWSLSLTGKLAQFNLSLLLIFAAIIVLFILCTRSSNTTVAVGGPIILFLLFIACVVLVFRNYSRQQPRPNGQPSSIELYGADGQKAIIRNPPDSFYTQGQTRELVRAIVLGYDEDLCPDGRVIGKASDQKYDLYSDEQKREFIEPTAK